VILNTEDTFGKSELSVLYPEIAVRPMITDELMYAVFHAAPGHHASTYICRQLLNDNDLGAWVPRAILYRGVLCVTSNMRMIVLMRMMITN